MLQSSAKPRLSSARFITFLALLLCALAIILVRALTFDEPLERDQTIYAVAAHEILARWPLYSDIWDIKPPAIYFIYAAAELVAGYGRGAIYLPLSALLGSAHCLAPFPVFWLSLAPYTTAKSARQATPNS